jgi:hypothetical protein
VRAKDAVKAALDAITASDRSRLTSG